MLGVTCHAWHLMFQTPCNCVVVQVWARVQEVYWLLVQVSDFGYWTFTFSTFRSRPGMAGKTYVLMTSFPSKELSDESQTLAEANLINAVVIQRMRWASTHYSFWLMLASTQKYSHFLGLAAQLLMHRWRSRKGFIIVTILSEPSFSVKCLNCIHVSSKYVHKTSIHRFYTSDTTLLCVLRPNGSVPYLFSIANACFKCISCLFSYILYIRADQFVLLQVHFFLFFEDSYPVFVVAVLLIFWFPANKNSL